MITQYTLPAVVAVTVAASLFGAVQTVRLSSEKASHTTTKLEYANADKKALKQALEDRDSAQAKADAQSRLIASWEQSQRPKVAAKKKEVSDAQNFSDCSNVALPDGLRDTLASTPKDFGATDTE